MPVRVYDSLAGAFGRRRAIQMLSLMTATVGLADLDTDEHTRLAGAVNDPDRIDDEVVRTLWATLIQARRPVRPARPARCSTAFWASTR